MQKKTAVAIAVVVSVLAGYGLGPHRGPTEGFANEPAPTGAASSPQTDFRCGPPEGEAIRDTLGPAIIFGSGSVSGTTKDYGYEVTNGRSWLNKKTGDYCVEEGDYVKFPNRPRIEGPKRGNSYTEQGKAVCYTAEIIIVGEFCAYKRPSENILWLSKSWFEGKCSDSEVTQLLAKHNLRLEDPRWENCDVMGAWKGIDLPSKSPGSGS